MRLLYPLSLMLFAVGAQAQTVWINSVQVLPANPTPGTPIKVVVKVSASNGGYLLSSSWARTNDTLRITNCYLCNPTAVVPTYTDTIKVGLLPAGQFTVKFLAQASPYANCSSATTARQNKSFQVSGALAATPAIESGWQVYPVPAAGRQLHLQRPGAAVLQALTLLDMAGRECFTTSFGSSPVADITVSLPTELATNTYTLCLRHADGSTSRHRVMLP